MPVRSDDSRSPILLVGASTRAAAHSALRGGLRPVCIDMFGDSDLCATADVVQVDDYPRDIPAALESFPEIPWMYTGGFENHPQIIERIATRARLLGNGAEVLAQVRNPWWLTATLRQ